MTTHDSSSPRDGMRYLLDTHVVLWMLDDARQLGPRLRDQITDPAGLSVYVW
jgi:PIN domain nuclease of toxin-antitoxin system